MAGLLFCSASAAALGYGAYLVFSTGNARRMFTDGREPTIAGLLALNIDLIFILVFATVLALLGLALFRRAGRSTNYVIRPEDRDKIWPLISETKSEAIDQYIRLASLSGFSGAFTKVGFTGLPLATVGLTVLFICLSLLSDNKDLMELGKLTLGAFIGSFVQRQVERGGRQDASLSGGNVSPTLSAPRLPV